MKTIQEAVINLLKVKSIVTLLMTCVFCYKAINNTLTQEFLNIYSIIIAFYFGTQYQKNAKNNTEYGIVNDGMTDEEVNNNIL